MVSGLIMTLISAAMFGSSTLHYLLAQLSVFIAHAGSPKFGVADIFGRVCLILINTAAVIALPVLFAGSAVVLLQTGFLLSVSNIRLDLARIDPRTGLGRLFGTDTVVEALKSLVKLAVISCALYYVIRKRSPELVGLASHSPLEILDRLVAPARDVIFTVLAMHLVIAAADILWTRFNTSQKLRMSRTEIKEEMKETDGDPKIKMKYRQIRAARSKKRMLAAVRLATVVVTNPTHYAVALAYNQSVDFAPKVVAKGVDEVAVRIREMAEKHGIPTVFNPSLVRALYLVEVDTHIPAEHYKVVSELIAYVWRLKRGTR